MSCWYLIQSHSGPDQVVRLVEAIKRSSPRAGVLVVHDSRGSELDGRRLRQWPGVEILVRSERVSRGDLSVLSPLFAGLEELLGGAGGRPRRAFDWLFYLSGQDYPVRRLDESEADLGRARHDGFLAWWDLSGPESPWRRRQGRTRYFCQYRRLPDWTLGVLKAVRFLGKVSPLRFHLHYGPFAGWEPRRTPFTGGVRCYGGSQWWTLSRPCVEYLHRALRSDDRIVAWFRRTVAPCEALVQTVLVNSGRFDLHPDNRRYTEFAGSRDGRPRILAQGDLPGLVGRFDFARKFDMERDPVLLDRIDAEVLGLDPAPRAPRTAA